MKYKHESGFTLLELLVVLSIWSTLLLLVIQLPIKQIDREQEKSFLNLFQMDVLYTQSLAMGVSDQKVKLLFKDNHYQIVKGNRQSLIKKRPIPKDIEIQTRTIKEISFDEHGRIRQPGSFIIETPLTTYQVIFPIGKGRCYVIEV